MATSRRATGANGNRTAQLDMIREYYLQRQP